MVAKHATGGVIGVNAGTEERRVTRLGRLD